MVVVLSLGLPPSHPDHALLKRIEDKIIEHAEGWERFRREVPNLIRQGIDEVIDAARSQRFTLDELEKTEKTYIGTKIEILLRNHLGLKRGKVLDVLVDDVEVDIKNTIGSAWTIPKEAIGHPCVLIREDEKAARCSFGLIVIKNEILNKGLNRDAKTTISAASLIHVHWMLRDEPYPRNFWEDIAPKTRLAIMSPTGGTARLVNLFRELQGVPIARKVVLAVAPQKDSLKRIRKNGGARDRLAKGGIALLSGKAHGALIEKLGLPKCSMDDFISFAPEREEDKALLRQAGEID
jgi:hypothetical protein